MSTRLAAVAALVPPGTRVADIGTDHGLLARHLLDTRRCPHCIATDLDRRALAALREWAVRRFPDGRLEVRHGDGLAALDVADRIQTVVLAGLGGRTIARLLEPAPALHVEHVVVQPQTESARVRRWLVGRGYGIVFEKVAFERRRFYEVVAARSMPEWRMPEVPGLSEEDLYEVGPVLAQDPDPRVAELWSSRLRRLEGIRARISPGAAAETAARAARRARRILAVLSGHRPRSA